MVVFKIIAFDLLVIRHCRVNCTIRVAKTKALISFAVTAKLICAFVFAYAYCWFSDAAAHFKLLICMSMMLDFFCILSLFFKSTQGVIIKFQTLLFCLL